MGRPKKDTTAEVAEEKIEIGEAPLWTSSEWTDYVMKHFTVHELINGKPTCDGLRRVFQHLVGPIIDVSVQVVNSPCNERNDSTVLFAISYQDKRLENMTRSITDAFNVSQDNTPWPWYTASVATATTKAEARVLRKGLGLIKILSNEEVEQGFDNINTANKTTTELKSIDGTVISNEGINDLSKTMINTIAFRTGIDVAKLLEKLGLDKDVSKLDNSTAKLIIADLQAYQLKPSSVPDSIKRTDLPKELI